MSLRNRVNTGEARNRNPMNAMAQRYEVQGCGEKVDDESKPADWRRIAVINYKFVDTFYRLRAGNSSTLRECRLGNEMDASEQ